MAIKPNESISCFALIADINDFMAMVQRGETRTIAQFTRDILAGAIAAIQNVGGEVVAFMGDAVLGLLPDATSAFLACAGIAKDVDRLCEFVSTNRDSAPEFWHVVPGGPTLKVGVEYGQLNTSTIESNVLGKQILVIGDAINYASRIIGAGDGNRCFVGPNAVSLIQAAGYGLEGPFEFVGKKSATFTYFELDLGDIWREGSRSPNDDTYWG